jgi:predicted transglutaminase-like cysteine proteinase
MRLFGYGERASVGVAEFPKWTRMLERYSRERAIETMPCREGACALQRWRTHIESLKGRSASEQLRAINAYVNRARFVHDSINYGIADHWATPRELFARGGDCEDFAITKYLSLKRLGWDMENVRVVVSMETRRRELHAILAVKTGGTIWILDNLLAEPADHSKVSQYRPIFSINEHAWWLHSRPGAPVVVSEDESNLLQRASCKTTSDFVFALVRYMSFVDAGPY